MAATDLKLGLSNLLGIVAPGSLLLGGLTTGVVGVEEYCGFHGYRDVLSAITGKEVIFTTAGLLIAYLFGASIRLFANDFAEVASGWYLRVLRRNRSPLATERFPYPFTTEWIEKNMNHEISDFLRSQSPSFGVERTKHFYNYCKMEVLTVSPKHAEYLESIESYVRFLSGALVSSIFTATLCFPLAILFASRHRGELCLTYGFVTLVMLIAIVSVLERFRHQHCREVVHTWLAYYDCSRIRTLDRCEHE